MARRLDFLIHDAYQSLPVTRHVSFDINSVNNVFEIRRYGNLCFSSDDLSYSIFNLQWLIHGEVLKDIPQSIRIHAGCVELEGKRFLVAGDKGTGKTTLLVRLLFEGFRAISDELVLVKDGKASPFPRRFHIKESSVALLPELNELYDLLPYNLTDYGFKMYSFTPHDAGFEWKIDDGEIRAILYLEPNHSADSRLVKCPKYLMAQKIMPMTFLSESDDHLKIGELCKLIDRVDCYILHIGALDGAVSAIRENIVQL